MVNNTLLDMTSVSKKNTLRELWKKYNPVSLLGLIERDNPAWTGETGREAGKQGISIRQTPRFLREHLGMVNPTTIGNTIFLPRTDEQINRTWTNTLGESGGGPDYPQGQYTIGQELPHVGQYRERGFLGFLLPYLSQMIKSKGWSSDQSWRKGGRDIYDIPVSKGGLEAFHGFGTIDNERTDKAAAIAERDRLLKILGMEYINPELQKRIQ